ncbi:aa3-type cytochrome c oxidase subunit IV [Paracoccus sp. JM45]|uniref:aa3-type cytochrome c oxidase subunit IV n=1 Tax=Paracoccus sp. JM45 TaxID=2283626 RepID=UPI000E6D3A49|nr:aa3-type cytochrome c oxidase subunit IV [Paracoccus sp. JM45]RJE80421.1 aa3-type cytochrome c oxidase subunit IV [Paracoccus sp. JM45]
MAEQRDNSYSTPGTMDITEQQKTFAGFIRAAIWVIGLSCAALVFMALTNA